MLEALIFDVDGTLSETEEIHRRAFNDTFRCFDLDWHWDKQLYKELLEVAGGKERLAWYIDTWQPAGGDLARPQIAELHAAKTARYTELIGSGVASLRSGIRRLVEAANEAGIAVAIATTTSLPNVESLLAVSFGAAWRQRFAVIAAGDMVPLKKPAPDVYALALRELGVSAARALAFEDSLNGLRSAAAAGIATVITPALYTADQDFSGAALIVDHLGDPGRTSDVRFPPDVSLPSGYVDLDSLRGLHARLAEAPAVAT